MLHKPFWLLMVSLNEKEPQKQPLFGYEEFAQEYWSVKFPTITRYFPLYHASATMNELNSGTQMEYCWVSWRGGGGWILNSPSFTTPDSPSEPHRSPPYMCVTRVMECTSTANRQVTNYWFALSWIFRTTFTLLLLTARRYPTHNHIFTVVLTCQFYWSVPSLLVILGLELVLFYFASNMISLTKQTKRDSKCSLEN